MRDPDLRTPSNDEPMRRTHHSALITVLLVLSLCGGIANASAQVCAVPESVRDMIGEDLPAEVDYGPLNVTGTAARTPLGIGHLRLSRQSTYSGRPPGENDWLRRVELPLSLAPGEEPTAWLVDGWIVAAGETPTPLSTRGLLETGYEELSFVVLDARSDGWLRIRYSDGDGSREDEDLANDGAGTGWTPTCALGEGAAPENALPVGATREVSARLDVTEWGDWFLNEFASGAISPLFFRGAESGALLSGPSDDAPPMVAIAADYILEPLEVRGEWMRVAVKEPSDYCEFDLVVAQREGWIRWYAPGPGPLVWYYTRGC
jgi:hypothetical protein